MENIAFNNAGANYLDVVGADGALKVAANCQFAHQTIAGCYTQVVSVSAQVMRFPSDLSAFLKLTAVSPWEGQGSPTASSDSRGHLLRSP